MAGARQGSTGGRKLLPQGAAHEFSLTPPENPLQSDLAPGEDGLGERIRYEALPDLPGVQLLVAHRSARLWRVLHDTYSICIIPENVNPPGARSHWCYRGRSYTVQPGWAMLIEPGEVHVTKRVNGAADFFVVMLDPSFVVRMAEELDLPSTPHLRLAQTSDPDIVVAFERFYASLRSDTAHLEQEARLSDCLHLLLERCAETTSRRLLEAPQRAVRRAREYLHEHAAEPVRLDDLVAVSGVSRFHLVHSFSRTYGLPPHAYQTQLRVATVREALRKGLRLPEIDAGFADQSHMGRHFKQIVGVSPGRYAALLIPARRRARSSLVAARTF